MVAGVLKVPVQKGGSHMTFPLQSVLPALTIFGLLLAIVVGLALYRHFVARQEDLHLHLTADETFSAAQQSGVANRLDWIDRWGKTFTVVVLVYFMVLLLAVSY